MNAASVPLQDSLPGLFEGRIAREIPSVRRRLRGRMDRIGTKPRKGRCRKSAGCGRYEQSVDGGRSVANVTLALPCGIPDCQQARLARARALQLDRQHRPQVRYSVCKSGARRVCLNGLQQWPCSQLIVPHLLLQAGQRLELG